MSQTAAILLLSATLASPSIALKGRSITRIHSNEVLKAHERFFSELNAKGKTVCASAQKNDFSVDAWQMRIASRRSVELLLLFESSSPSPDRIPLLHG